MATEAGWYPDPTGAHERRRWDGTRWTDEVEDAGNRSWEVPPPDAPPPDPADAAPPVAGSGATGPGAPPAGIGPWQRRLADTADRAAVQGRRLADQVGATIDEQRARRRGR